MTGVLMKRDIWTDMHTGRTSCEDGGRGEVTFLQAKGHHDWCDQLNLGASLGQVPLRGPRRNQPCRHLDFGLLTSRAGRESVSAV